MVRSKRKKAEDIQTAKEVLDKLGVEARKSSKNYLTGMEVRGIREPLDYWHPLAVTGRDESAIQRRSRTELGIKVHSGDIYLAILAKARGE